MSKTKTKSKTKKISNKNSRKKKKKQSKKEAKREINKIIKKSIDNLPLSILNLLFGPFYLLYKKEFVPAIITIIIYIFVSMYFTFEINIFIKIIINLYLAFKYNNLKKSKKTINIYAFIIIVALYMIITKLVTIEKPIFYKSTKNQLDNITYKIPNNVKEYKTSSKTKYYMVRERKKGNCFITISVNETNLTTPEQYLSETEKYNTNYVKSKFTNKKINKIDWTNQKLTNKTSKKDLYVTKKDKKVYEVKFESTNSYIDLCKGIKKDILQSIKIKEME